MLCRCVCQLDLLLGPFLLVSVCKYMGEISNNRREHFCLRSKSDSEAMFQTVSPTQRSGDSVGWVCRNAGIFTHISAFPVGLLQLVWRELLLYPERHLAHHQQAVITFREGVMFSSSLVFCEHNRMLPSSLGIMGYDCFMISLVHFTL